MRKNISAVVMAGLLSVGAQVIFAQSRPLTEVQVKRLAGLGRLWGTVKLFHPWLPSEAVDWDKALVEAIPKVKAAGTSEEYRDAVQGLLAALNDPATKAVIPAPLSVSGAAEAASKAGPVQAPSFKWLKDGQMLVTARDFRAFMDPPAIQPVLLDLSKQSAKASSVIFDFRRDDRADSTDDVGSYYFSSIFGPFLGMFVHGVAALPFSRYRMHSGYPPQIGMTSGGYYSAFVDVQAAPIAGQAARKIALVFLVNERGTGLESEIAALQAAGPAVCICEGEKASDQSASTQTIDLPDGVKAEFRMGEAVNPDGSTGFRPDRIVARSVGAPPGADAALDLAIQAAEGKILPAQREPAGARVGAATLDRPYYEMRYPSEEYRLLGLFRYWNAIHYFFPYKHLLDRPWDGVLEETIPLFVAAENALAYSLAAAELATKIQDSHSSVGSRDLRPYYGTHVPPLAVKWIEEQSVVTHVFAEAGEAGGAINPGDVVLAVDGEEAAARRDRLARTSAASTLQALQWRIHQRFLAGPDKSEAKIKIRKADGRAAEVILKRTMAYPRYVRPTPVFSVLSEGFGYMDLERLTIPEVDKAFETIKNTPAVIFDMRGYPQGTAWSIAPRLAEKKTIVAKFQRPEVHGIRTEHPSLCVFDQTIEPAEKWRYAGKVVVLINEEAISQAEHTCLFFEATAGATFIGSPTNGANGDVTMAILPGGITMSFTGHDVRHADGRQLQRVGIQPHILVRPTIAGIRAGRDEVLERAVSFLKTGK